MCLSLSPPHCLHRSHYTQHRYLRTTKRIWSSIKTQKHGFSELPSLPLCVANDGEVIQSMIDAWHPSISILVHIEETTTSTSILDMLAPQLEGTLIMQARSRAKLWRNMIGICLECQSIEIIWCKNKVATTSITKSPRKTEIIEHQWWLLNVGLH